MRMKFSANLGFLFCENNSNLLEKYKFAKASGFKAVEHPFPAKEIDHLELLKVKNDNNLEVVLVNIETEPEFPFGCAGIPGKEEMFQKNFQNTISFAKMFNCKKIHIMSGKEAKTPEHHGVFLKNLKYATKFLEQEGIIGVLEPINHISVPDYFLHDYNYALDVIKTVGSSHLKLMVDLFHMQILNGNIINTLKPIMPVVGHVQIAQTPDRNEPNTPGELNLQYILDFLEKNGYTDHVGCEYRPLTTTSEGLSWIQQFGYKL